VKMLHIRSQHLKRQSDEGGLHKITKEQGSIWYYLDFSYLEEEINRDGPDWFHLALLLYA